MLNLIFILLSIALLGIFLGLGLNSLSTNKITSHNYEKRMDIAFTLIKNQLSDYRKVYGKLPNKDNWETELYPDFGNKPEIGFGTFSIIEESESTLLCLDLNNNDFNESFVEDVSGKNDLYTVKNTNCDTQEGVSIVQEI